MGEDNKNTQSESLIISEDWKVHYDYGAGVVASRFLRGLAEKKIEGTKCPHCGIVALPPRGYCEKCFVKADEWVPVSQEGVLEAATIVMSKFQNLPDPPYVVAFCRLDGAHTAMANFLQMDLHDVEAAAAKLKVGTRIKICFHETRDSRMTDFHYELL